MYTDLAIADESVEEVGNVVSGSHGVFHKVFATLNDALFALIKLGNIERSARDVAEEEFGRGSQGNALLFARLQQIGGSFQLQSQLHQGGRCTVFDNQCQRLHGGDSHCIIRVLGYVFLEHLDHVKLCGRHVYGECCVVGYMLY